METRKSWERERGEPSNWHNRLDKYFRPLGPERTIEQAWRLWKQAEAVGSTGRRPSAWWYAAAKRWKWGKRCDDWDKEQQQQRWREEREQIDAMNKRHLQIAIGLQSAGGRSLQKLTSELQSDPDASLSASEIRHFLGDGIDLERMTRGLPTELIKIMGMSDEELVKAYGGVEDEDSESD